MSLIARCRRAIRDIFIGLITNVIWTVGAPVAALVLLWFISGLIQYANATHPPATTSDYLELILIAGRKLVDYVAVRSTGTFIKHPTITVLYLILVATVVVFVRSLNRTKQILNSQVTQIQQRDDAIGLLKRAGLEAHFPNAQNKGGTGSWDDLCSEISKVSPTHLDILVANGAKTFGNPDAPLHQLLRDFGGSLRVLLASPTSADTKARAADLRQTVQEYSGDIERSVEFLRLLRSYNRSVSVRHYIGRPTWKMVLTPSTLRLQYYQPVGRHVEDTPVFLLFDNRSPMNLFHCFVREFQRVWEENAAHEIDLRP